MEAKRSPAFWEFAHHFITPTVERLLRSPGDAHAVELGYGDGRMLCPAASFFGRVTGIALSEEDDRTKATKAAEPCSSVLFFDEADAATAIPLDSESAQFVYSRQGVAGTLPDLSAFELLVREIERVLAPGGVAILWFGRMSRLPFCPPGRSWLRGWDQRSIPGEPGRQRLHLRMFHARRAVLRADMKAVSLSTPLHPDTSWRLLRGGAMSYITAWKPT